jgi:hypothetical protein
MANNQTNNLKKIWGSTVTTREEFEKNRFLFIEENWEY